MDESAFAGFALLAPTDGIQKKKDRHKEDDSAKEDEVTRHHWLPFATTMEQTTSTIQTTAPAAATRGKNVPPATN